MLRALREIAPRSRLVLVCVSFLSTFAAPTMSWRSHGTDNKSLIDALVRNDIVKNKAVEEGMRLVDRGHFTPVNQQPYEDSPQPIGYAATISAPHMHAYCLELLAEHLRPGAKALDVGHGTGYLAAVMANMVGSDGKVVGIEHIPMLVDMSLENFAKDSANRALLASGRVKLLEGDGYKGRAEDGPYDCIHVGAAAPQIPPALVDQLAPGGRLVIPVGTEKQGLMVVDRSADGEKLTQHEAMGVRYVPLTTREKQLGSR